MKGEKWFLLRVSVILGILFLTRILLIIFPVGIFPSLEPDIIFYASVLAAGTAFMMLYLLKIEDVSLEELGFKRNRMILGLIFGVLASFGLLLLSALALIPFSGIPINLYLTPEKIAVAVLFALGGIYEETFFRGLLQNYFQEKYGEYRAILIQSGLFLAIHIGYLPFTGFGIYYLIIFSMALVLGVLRSKFDLYSSSTCHVLYVFLAALVS